MRGEERREQEQRGGGRGEGKTGAGIGEERREADTERRGRGREENTRVERRSEVMREERRGEQGEEWMVMVRGKEGAGKRACKRTLAISMRVAPARGNSPPTHIRASLYLEYARACKTWRAVA